MRIVSKAKCSDISSEGKGVVKLGKEVVFVDGLFPDEEADIGGQHLKVGVREQIVVEVGDIIPDVNLFGDRAPALDSFRERLIGAPSFQGDHEGIAAGTKTYQDIVPRPNLGRRRA